MQKPIKVTPTMKNDLTPAIQPHPREWSDKERHTILTRAGVIMKRRSRDKSYILSVEDAKTLREAIMLGWEATSKDGVKWEYPQHVVGIDTIDHVRAAESLMMAAHMMEVGDSVGGLTKPESSMLRTFLTALGKPSTGERDTYWFGQENGETSYRFRVYCGKQKRPFKEGETVKVEHKRRPYKEQDTEAKKKKLFDESILE